VGPTGVPKVVAEREIPALYGGKKLPVVHIALPILLLLLLFLQELWGCDSNRQLRFLYSYDKTN